MNKDIFQLCESISEQESFELDIGRYVAQEKFDGTRAIIVVKNKEVIMFNRRDEIIDFKFPEIVEELSKLDDVILDGEIIARTGIFEDLQRRALLKNRELIKARVKEIPVVLMIFDVLRIGNQDLRNLPLRERTREMFNFFEGLKFNHIEIADFKPIKEMYSIAKEKNGEGIIVKDLEGKYLSSRNANFRKLKFFKEGTLKVIRYTENPKGIRVEDREGKVVQIAGHQSIEVKERLDRGEEVEIIIQYMSSQKGNYRFPSYRGLK